MTQPTLELHFDDLLTLAAARPAQACHPCEVLRAQGWQSLGGGHDLARLEPVGTLRHGEPTVAEYHDTDTNFWSERAPIAPRYYPYNTCTVWRCRDCSRAFLRYVEHGGYYCEERIRELCAELLVDAPPASPG